jgi:hypothetical protein
MVRKRGDPMPRSTLILIVLGFIAYGVVLVLVLIFLR